MRASTAEPPSAVPVDRRTPRERELLRLLAEGKRVKEVALELKITAKPWNRTGRIFMDKLEFHPTIEVSCVTYYSVVESGAR